MLLSLAASAESRINCKKPYSNLEEHSIDSIKKSCSNVAEILNTFESFDVGIGFAGEYVENPASAFGHTFLIFIDKENFLQSQTISYLADTKSESNFFRYAFKGSFGGFQGVFKNVPLYKLEHVYKDIESRDLWVYEFDRNVLSKEKLLLAIIEEENSEYLPYYFFNYNCTSALRKLISKSVIDQVKVKKRFLDYPASLIVDLKAQISKVHSFTNKESLLYIQRKKISDSEFEKIRQALERRKPIELKQNSNVDNYLETLYDYYSFKVHTVKEHKELANIFPPLKFKTKNKELKDPTFQPRSVAISRGELNGIKTNKFEFRPTYKSKAREQNHQNNRSELELLKLSVIHTNNSFTFSNATLFDLENQSHYEWPSYILSKRTSLFFDRYCNDGCSATENIKLNYYKGISKIYDVFGIASFMGPSVINLWSQNKVMLLASFSINSWIQYKKILLEVDTVFHDSFDRFKEFRFKSSLSYNFDSYQVSFEHNINDMRNVKNVKESLVGFKVYF